MLTAHCSQIRRLSMNHYRSLSHTTRDCKYHLIWTPNYRKKVLFGNLRKYLGDVFRKLALQKESKVLQGHLMRDHVHMLVSIPQKSSGPAFSWHITKFLIACDTKRTFQCIGIRAYRFYFDLEKPGPSPRGGIFNGPCLSRIAGVRVIRLCLKKRCKSLKWTKV